MYTKSSELTQGIIDAIEILTPDPFAAVYYGDQELIPKFPAITIESVDKERDLAGKASSHKFNLILRSQLIIYHEKIQSSQLTRKEDEQLADQVEDFLSTPAMLTMSGQVVFGFVTRVTPGVVVKPGRIMLRATRLTYEAFSRQTF